MSALSLQTQVEEERKKVKVGIYLYTLTVSEDNEFLIKHLGTKASVIISLVMFSYLRKT